MKNKLLSKNVEKDGTLENIQLVEKYKKSE